MESTLSFEELKRDALTRRVNKLISWLHRPDYASWVSHESTTQLIKLIDLIIWALERSISEEDWEQFRMEFLDTRFIVADTFQNDVQESSTYYTALSEVEDTLLKYLTFIN